MPCKEGNSFSKNDLLFVDYHVYDYLFDYEISINAFIYHIKTFRCSVTKFLESKKDELPLHIANMVESNAKFY